METCRCWQRASRPHSLILLKMREIRSGHSGCDLSYTISMVSMQISTCPFQGGRCQSDREVGARGWPLGATMVMSLGNRKGAGNRSTNKNKADVYTGIRVGAVKINGAAGCEQARTHLPLADLVSGHRLVVHQTRAPCGHPANDPTRSYGQHLSSLMCPIAQSMQHGQLLGEIINIG